MALILTKRGLAISNASYSALRKSPDLASGWIFGGEIIIANKTVQARHQQLNALEARRSPK